MVSGPGAGMLDAGEGWPMLVTPGWSKMSCKKPEIPEGEDAPNFLHYCQTYAAYDTTGNRWLWHKGHVPHNILDCDSPILKSPPDDLYNTQESPRAKRYAWMVCMMHYKVNEMLKAYKSKFCQRPEDKKMMNEIGLEERIRLIHEGTEGLPCGPKGCYPIAQYEPKSGSDNAEMVPRDNNDNDIYFGD